MRIGFYDPYLDTLGGGERYLLTLVDDFCRKNHQVDLFWPHPQIKKEIKNKFGFDLKKIDFVEDIFSSRINLFQKWQKTRKYDAFFFISDGSLPFLFAKKNIIIFLVPFTRVHGRSFLNKVKLLRLNPIVTISQFNKKFIDQEYGVKSQVIAPPVNVKIFSPGKKEKLILSVGRFYHSVKSSSGLIRPLHSKKQEILIEVFKQMCDQGLKDWQLRLVGGMVSKDKPFLNRLKKKAAGYPIEFQTNLSLTSLKQNYARAKIYWHAAGFGEKETKHPERMEHFGITTVEAMAAGAVPVVVAQGGQPEIVKDKTTGLLWQTKAELVQKTLQLIDSPKLWQKLSSAAIKESQKFDQKIFVQKFDEIIQV